MYHNEKIKIEVKQDSLERLDMYAAMQSSLSRSQIHRLIKSGDLLVNGESKKPHYRVRLGDVIEMFIAEPEPSPVIAQLLPLDIIWEDEHVIVVNKLPSMVVYPAAGHREGTLLNALLYQYRTLAGSPLRPGIVHRLDKDTSGIMVVARSDEAYRSLTRQFRDRKVKKHYRAIAFGSVPYEMTEIRAPIGRSRGNRKKMSTRTSQGREAITYLEVIENYKNAAFLDITLITGRTHQIRVHLASRGHPILGDSVYGRKTVISLKGKKVPVLRQMLHSYSLGFMHPVRNDFVTFKAALPDDMEALLKALKENEV